MFDCMEGNQVADSVESRRNIWYPFAGKSPVKPMLVDRAEGVFIYDGDGKPYTDLISSWWVNLYGHSNPVIADAIAKQSARMEHVMFAGFTHTPALDVCEGLLELLPSKLERFFFSDNGSTAVEVALKLAFQFWRNKGDFNKKIFLAFKGGYHGDTWGAMSVGRGCDFYKCFEDFMLPSQLFPYPCTWYGDDDIEDKENNSLLCIKKYLDIHADEIVAFIMEPLVQGAGGMRVCRPQFLIALMKLLKDYGVIVIFDEVMTGFGRTGSDFVASLLPEGLEPDFLCLAKGITGGFLPMAVTVIQDYIYDSFLELGVSFNHGHSYTANPIACAASVAALGLFKGYKDRIKVINQVNEWILENCLLPVGDLITKIRIAGTIMAFELNPSVKFTGTALGLDVVMHKLSVEFLLKGLLLRPLGNVIYTIPPYCITNSQLKGAYADIISVLKSNLAL